jgi:hypothetical protein
MALEKREKLTPLQRVRVLILGRERPNLVTRVSVGIGFGIWVYLVTWQILTLMTLLLMSSIDQSELLQSAFSRVGSNLYGYTNTIGRLTIHNIVELIAYGAVLIGLIFIYRKKRIGFLIYIIGNFVIIMATPLILGLKYFQHEMSYSYVIMIGVSTLYFSIGALWFYKWKPANQTDNFYSK